MIEKQQEHGQRKTNLVTKFSDDFSKDYGPPDHFDMVRWTRMGTGKARVEKGYWLLDVRRPPEVAVGGFATTERSFNPGLAGTNGVEITIAGFTHEEADPGELEHPEQMRLIQAWGMTIGSWQGLMGMCGEKERGVQLHFDLILPNGLFVYMVRALMPEDSGKYPKDGYAQDLKDLSEIELRQLHEDAVEQGEIFATFDNLSLAGRVYRLEQDKNEILGRRRWGLYLTDDANTVYWTLDGQVMDCVDISGYFSSSPESVREGAFLSIMAVGLYQRNTWKMADLEVRVSP